VQPYAYTGGSHIGRAPWFGDGSTYGSVYRPAEPGSGAWDGQPGGGQVRIQASED